MCCIFPAVMNVSFVSTRVEVVEGEGVVMLNLEKTTGALGPVSVQIASSDGTAIGTCDPIIDIVIYYTTCLSCCLPPVDL